MNKHILIFICCLFSFQLFSQNCGTTEIHEQCLLTDPDYAENMLQLEEQIRDLQKNMALNNAMENDEVLTIPIVFHIIHNGGVVGVGSNIAEVNILAAVDKLNNDFANLNGNGADTNIEFCLATNDPNGNPTNGINRVDGSVLPNYVAEGIRHSGSGGVLGTTVKDLSRWPTDFYYNIWIVNLISNNNPGGVAGYASYPSGSDYDGTVIKYNYTNTSTITHELGHGFSLRHTFQGSGNGCPLNDDCLEQGDLVCDTPPHRQNDCSISSCSAGDISNSTSNYMSYCSSRQLFTEGQKDRMRATLSTYPRENLLLSMGCSPILANNIGLLEIDEDLAPVCGGLYYPRIKIINFGSNVLSSFEVEYQLDGQNSNTQTISASLSYGEESWFELNPIPYNAGNTSFTVTIQSPNGQPDGYPEFDTKSISIEFEEDVILTPDYIEDFESYSVSDFFPTGWTKRATQNGETVNSGWRGISNSLTQWFNSGGINGDGGLAENIATMPRLNLSGYSNTRLLFKYLFTNPNDDDISNTSFAVAVLSGCNSTANIVWQKTGEDLLTTDENVGFDFNYGEVVEIDLSAYDGEEIYIEFIQSTSINFSPSINLDNINILGDLNGMPNLCPIPLTSNMMFNENGSMATGFGSAASLVDEQNTMGEPPYGNGTNVENGWTSVNNTVAYLDLGETYDISDIYLFDGFGSGQFEIAPGLPNENLSPIIDIDLDIWPPQWRDFQNLDFTNRYITFRKIDPNARVHEIYICGEPSNGVTPTCMDGIQNQNETGIDCGGVCPPCQPVASCSDGIQNQNETGIDCGGVCPPCQPVASCSDGIQNQNETGVDCGGVCSPCQTGGCPDNVAGYTMLGEYNDSKYFISNNSSNWMTARNNAIAAGGHLVSITSQEENLEIFNWIDEIIFIGLNDIDMEGTPAWQNGDPFTFNTINDQNTSDRDYGKMNNWNGNWGWDNMNANYRSVLEIPCDGGGCNCPTVYDPVCGSDGVTYSNSCEAECAGIFNYTNGACTTGSGCPNSLAGFTTLGEFGNSKYYLSNDMARPEDAQANAVSLGGDLVAINSASENNFIQQNISEMVYIGLNDKANEGMFKWFNGEPFTYDNIAPCSFCNENSDALDYLIIAPWNGKWSFSSQWNSRKYIVEIPCDGGGGNDLPDLTISNITNLDNPIPSGGIAFFNIDLNNVGTAVANGDYNITFYITNEVGVFPNYTQVGNIMRSNTPIGTTTAVPVSIDVASSLNGNYFLVAIVDSSSEIMESNEDNNELIVPVTFGTGGGGCPTSLSGFTSIGEFNGSAYFFSDNSSRPTDAQATCESQGGYLASISSQEENDFIQQGISGIAYIGLNDEDMESTLKWFSGEPVGYDNLDICSFCNENSDNQDYGVMASWSGGWSWSNFWNQRRFVMEIPCSSNSTLIAIPNQNLTKIDFQKIVPNPANNHIFVQVKSKTKTAIDVEIYNARGMLLKSQPAELFDGINAVEIDIADFPSGFYFVKIPQMQGQHATQRFIKVRD